MHLDLLPDYETMVPSVSAAIPDEHDLEFANKIATDSNLLSLEPLNEEANQNQNLTNQNESIVGAWNVAILNPVATESVIHESTQQGITLLFKKTKYLSTQIPTFCRILYLIFQLITSIYNHPIYIRLAMMILTLTTFQVKSVKSPQAIVKTR